MKSLRLFVAGQKAFGAAVFEKARELGHEVVGVSAPPMSDDGKRSDRLRFAAERAGVPWMPAGTLNADTLPGGVDLILAAHSHDFIGRRTRNRARLGGVGYHPSLLPLHRGRDAVRWALHMGDRVTGGTVYWLSDNVDCGDIAAQAHAFIRPGDTAEALWRRELFPLGVRLFAQVLGDLASGRLVAVPQKRFGPGSWEPSFERPPLYRPDLLQIGGAGAGGLEGFTVIRSVEGDEEPASCDR